MKVLCLGGAGKIGREAILDLVQFSNFEKITIGDINEDEGMKVLKWLDDGRVDFQRINVNNTGGTISQMKDYDMVMDCTPVRLNNASTMCIAESGCSGVNLNGYGDENKSDGIFKKNNKVFVSGFGMSPGMTQMMAKHAAAQLDTVESVRISHSAYRPFAFSRSIAETTMYEYDSSLKSRIVYEDGEYIQLPPFSRPIEVTFPEPYGRSLQYILPHPEVITLSGYLKNKGVKLVEVRGAWSEKIMQLLKVLYDWGFLRNDRIEVIEHTKVGILDCIIEYLSNSKEGNDTELFGYALHVEVTGTRNGKKYRHVMTNSHPSSDGSVRNWVKLRAYTRNVGIPLSIATMLIASGGIDKTGVISPENAFDPETVFKELEKRHIYSHQTANLIE
jgi:lysine 6-dehydrogenase